jgi:hypothetical protein
MPIFDINAQPRVESGLISEAVLKRIYHELGIIFGRDGTENYDQLILLLEEAAKNNFSDYLNKIRACSRSIFIRNVLSSDQLSQIAARYGIKAPVSFSPPVMHISSAKLLPEAVDLSPHQDWPSCLGSFNSIIVWICLGGATKESGGLDFYCSDRRIPLLGGAINPSVIESRPEDLAQFEKKYFYVLPGDAIVFGHFLPHGSQNGKTRIAISLRIEDASDVFWQKRGYEYAQITQINRKQFTEDELFDINTLIKKN